MREAPRNTQGVVKGTLLRAIIMSAVLAVILMGIHTASAAEDKPEGLSLVPMGNAVGIKLFSDGVVVVGFSDIVSDRLSAAPAKSCGLREGDIITHINQTEVDTIEEVRAILQEAGNKPLFIRVSRGEKQMEVETVAIRSNGDGQYKLGAWIRDSMAGIGTVTYYNPATGDFAALGHPINDIDTGIIMPLEEGAIMPATVVGVRRGEKGNPGELQGAFDMSIDLGELTANTSGGVFGSLNCKNMVNREAIPVLERGEVQLGKAVIYSTVGGDSVLEFEVELTRVYPEGAGDNRDLMLKVTDPALLAITGGIVQGMSGSPIIQNGKLVGAVTHVMVNDPTQGYGILASSMFSLSNGSTG